MIKDFHIELDHVHFLPLDLSRVTFGILLVDVGRKKRERSKRKEGKEEGKKQEGEMGDRRKGEEGTEVGEKRKQEEHGMGVQGLLEESQPQFPMPTGWTALLLPHHDVTNHTLLA